MIALRRIAIAVLAMLGLAAGTAAVLWAGSFAGLAQPVVVVSDATQPYRAGDLLVSTRMPTTELAPGDVVTVASAGIGPRVAERIVAIQPAADGVWTVTTGTSATDRTTEHRLGDEAWTPTLRVPVVGGIVAAVVEPQVGLPLIALVGFLIAVLLVGRAPARVPALRMARARAR
jgi:hypothetical protein